MNDNLGKGFVLATNDDRTSYGNRVAYIVDLIWSLNIAPSLILSKVAPIYSDAVRQVVSEILDDFAPTTHNAVKLTRQVFNDVKIAYDRRHAGGFYYAGTDWILNDLKIGGLDV